MRVVMLSMWLVSSLLLLTPPVIGSFVVPSSSFTTSKQQQQQQQQQQQRRQPPPRTTLLHASSNAADRTLYDILGASPRDSHEVLRLKYTTLARQTHPDAVGTQSSSSSSSTSSASSGEMTGRFSEIAAAWHVLSDPKERLRYDRQLKAKEFTDTVESLLETSLSTAIPFLRKTANTTLAAAEVTGKNMHTMGQRVGHLKTILDLENRRRDLEQQASREMTKANQLYSQLENLENTRLDLLNGRAPKTDLTSAKALRLLNGFNTESSSGSKQMAQKEIAALKEMEQQHSHRVREVENSERDVKVAYKQVKDAMYAEKLALERLEQAQRDVEEARKFIDESKRFTQDATQREKVAHQALQKIAVTLDQRAERVRSALRKTEDESLALKADTLRDQCSRLEDSAEQLYAKAQEIAAQVEQRKKEEAL